MCMYNSFVCVYMMHIFVYMCVDMFIYCLYVCIYNWVHLCMSLNVCAQLRMLLYMYCAHLNVY